jgi:hypothetical protein
MQHARGETVDASERVKPPATAPRGMPPYRAAFAALLLLTAAVLAGCLESMGEDAEQVTLTVTPGEATVTGEAPARFTVTLTVNEEMTITHRGCPPYLLDAVVTGVSDQNVTLYPYGEEPQVGPCVLQQVTLEPGTFTRDFDWNGHVDANAPHPHGGARVQTGTFTVVASLAAKDVNLTAEAPVHVT